MSSKILQIYADAGIDEIISETPVNRFESAKQESKKQEEPKEINKSLPAITPNNLPANPQPSTFNQPISTFGAISKLAQRQNNDPNMTKLRPLAEILAESQKMANEAKNLAELEQAVKDFDGCSLKKMATNTVFADGDPKSPIMIIGEAPGNHEDLQGIPFCGDSGKLLNSMFKNIGFDRENLYITNTLFWRPPGNRRPTKDELAMCRPFVEKHIALVKPKLMVLMGATAMADILKLDGAISKMRGKFFDYEQEGLAEKIKATVLFHPSYLMRQSAKKRDAWKDLLMIKDFLKDEK